MNQSPSPTGQCTIRQAAMILVAQAAAVLVVAGLLMLTLRGRPPEQWQINANKPNRYRAIGPLPIRAPQVEPQWASKEELLAAAPPRGLSEQRVTVEGVEFAIQLPVEAKIADQHDQGFSIVAHEVKVIVEFGYANFEALRDEQYDAASFPFLDEDIFIVETNEVSDQRYRFHANRKFGLLELRASTPPAYRDPDGSVSLSDCLLMLRCWETLSVHAGEPKDLADAILIIGGEVHTNRQAEVVGIDLNYAETCPAIVERLAEFPALEWLRLGDHQLPPASLQVLPKLPELTQLHAGNYSYLGVEGFASVCQCAKLETFIGNVNSIDVGQWDDFAKLTRLSRIELRGIEDDTLAGVPALGKLTELYDLTLNKRTAADWPLAFLAQLPQLRRLELHGEMSDQSVGELVKVAPGIEELRLLGAGLTDPAMETLCQLQRLKSLELWRDEPMSADEAMFAPPTAQRLPKKPVTAAGLAHLSKLRDLESFSFVNAPLDDSAVDVFLQLPKLTVIDLANSQITDAALKTLAMHEPLERLEVRDCEHITLRGIREFRKARPDVTLWR